MTDVTWLDDAVSVTVPLETADADTVETYYKDGNALFSVTIAEDKRIEAVDAIREIVGEDNAMTDSAVTTAVATTGTVKEISLIAAIAVAFVLFVLLLTTDSFAEPFLVLGGLGIAIVINAGSNLLFGEISFVTNAAGNILQLAVSLDYSVFLLHRFAECRKTTPDVKEAMVQALTASTSSILSSGLTTVIGFLALCLMQFGIGPDLGLALAKGVAISLITVFVFMPALILSTYKWIDKTAHRSFMPSFAGFGRFVRRVMLPMAAMRRPCRLFPRKTPPCAPCSSSSKRQRSRKRLPPQTAQRRKRRSPSGKSCCAFSDCTEGNEILACARMKSAGIRSVFCRRGGFHPRNCTI